MAFETEFGIERCCGLILPDNSTFCPECGLDGNENPARANYTPPKLPGIAKLNEVVLRAKRKLTAYDVEVVEIVHKYIAEKLK